MKFDSFAPPVNAPTQDQYVEAPSALGEASKGFSRGLRGLGGDIVQGAGLGAEALGYNDTARSLRGTAKGLRDAAEAPQYAPEAATFADAHGAGQTARWVMGKAGELVPMLGAAVAGGEVAGPLVGGTMALMPSSVGAIDARQQADPSIAAQPVAERGLRALGYGTAGALAGNIPLGGLASKFGAKALLPGLEAAGSNSLAGAVVRNVGEGAVTGGLGMGAMETANQMGVNPNAKFDTDAIRDAAIGGAVTVGAMHLPAAIPGALRGKATQVGEALASGKKSINEQLAARKAAAEEAQAAASAPEAEPKFSSGWDEAQSMLKKGRTKVDDTIDRVMKGTPLGDLGAFAEAQGQKLKDLVQGSDKEVEGKVQEWGEEMLSKMPEGDSRAQQVKDFMANAGDQASQKGMAGMKKAWDAGQAAAGTVSRFADSVRNFGKDKTTVDGEVTDVSNRIDGPKKSEDYSGAERVVLQALHDSGLSERRPELFESNDSINNMASALRDVGQHISRGPLSADVIAKAIDAFGPDTSHVLQSVVKGLSGGKLDPAATEHMFKNINEIVALQDSKGSLHDFIGGSLTDDAKSSTLSSHLPKLADLLVRHAKGELTAGKGAAETAATNRSMAELMQEHFGAKSDAVSKRVEKEAGLGKGRDERSGMPEHDSSTNGALNEDGSTAKHDVTEGAGGKTVGKFDESGNRMGEQDLDTMKFGLTKADKAGKNKSKLNGDPMAEDNGYVKQHISDLETKYPGHKFEWVKDETRDDGKGHIVGEKAADPEALTANDVESMRLDEKYPNSPDKVMVGGRALDTKRIAGVMDKRLEYSAADEQSRAHRMARMFNEGLARLMEKHGTVDAEGNVSGMPTVPDSAVIGKIGGKNFTFGEAKRLDSRTVADKASDANTQEMVDLRKQYKATTNEKTREAIRNRAAEITLETDGAKDAELGQGDDVQGRTARPKVTLLEKTDGPASPIRTKSEAAGARKTDNGVGIDPSKPRDPSKDAQIHEAAKDFSAKDLINRSNMDGSGVFVSDRASGNQALNNLANEFKARGSKAQQALGDKIKDLIQPEVFNAISPADKAALARVLADKTPSKVAALINPLVEKYKGTDKATKSAPESKGVEGNPDPKAPAAKKAAFLERAASGDEALAKELTTSSDAKGLQRAIEALNDVKKPTEGHIKALDAANKRLGELMQDPDTAYGMGTKKYSLESAEATDPNINNAATPRLDIKDHIEKVLGKSVRLAWAKFTHAGEYVHAVGQGVIRLSVHALDPMSTAYHESLHAFFAQMKDAGAHDISGVLEKAASSKHVIDQLREIYKGQPEVLKQLRDPEERAAYMYQQWALDPKGFKVAISAKGTFGRIADFIREAMGVWTNDQRALHIMDYFHTGEYAKDIGRPSAVRGATMEVNRNNIYETAKSFTEPLARMADAVGSMGSSRMHDTGIPALGKLADLIKRDHLDASGKDQGFIQATRVEATQRRGKLAEAMQAYSSDQLHEAMEALQTNTAAASPEARLAARTIKKFLGETRDYMVKAGVDVANKGPDYFPRVWDTHYISKNQQAFRDMLEPYIRSGAMKGTADELLRTLTNRGGNEFGIETREPGMQFVKERKLDFLNPRDAAQFVSKDLHGTLNSYLTQATRRAEWTRRLGEGKLEDIIQEAKDQGATKEHLELADKYLKGVDGTLGDNINPDARRIMGNMIVYQNLRLLPMASFSMLIDPLGTIVRGGTMGEAFNTFKRGMGDLKHAWGKEGPTRDQATEFAELVGTVDSAILSHTMGDTYTQGMVGGLAQKANNSFFKFNLVESMNRSFRIGATESAMSFLARHADGKESLHSKRWMDELNIKAGDIQKTPEGRIALSQADGLTAEQEYRVHAALNQWVDGAILRPDAADKPIWMYDPRYALVSHLKQFVFSFQKTILERVGHEMSHGNYTPAMALASYVPVMMGADIIKGMIQNNGDTPDWQAGWGLGDYVSYGVQRAGLLGVGQFGLDVAKDVGRGNSGFFALSGPTIEQLRDGVEVLGGHKQFGGAVLDAMPANALYKHNLGGVDNGGPMFAD